jgi:type VI secretion system secreted protein Hcp
MAQDDYFLKIDGVDGESKDDMFPNWIQIDSWTAGGSNSKPVATGGGSGAGKVSVKDVVIQDVVSAATPTIHKFMLIGKRIAWAEIDCRKAGDTPQVYLKIKLTDVLISDHQVSARKGSSDLPPGEQFSLNFAMIEFAYGAQDEKGNVMSLDKKMGYDLRTNK